MAGICMFIFKFGSRNNTDKVITSKFEGNFIRIFNLRLPLMDTVHVFLKKLCPSELEKINQILVQKLIKKRVLDKFRYNGRYIVAIDGTGVFSFDHEPFAGCPHKTSKNGKKTWQAYVLEAKIICSNGFSISLATEWLHNSDDINEKQDCELKAFSRLASKIKKMYPRLPIIIAADSLYPNNTVFNSCKEYNWKFIFTFKDGVLKSIWNEIHSLYPLNEDQNRQEKLKGKDKLGWRIEKAMFINDIEYHKHHLSWIEYVSTYIHESEPKERFVHVTDLDVNKDTIWEISLCGRLRWKIENEGFNTQKNHGYNMQHKYSRKHFGAMQNYYQLLQIAHLINQLTEKSTIAKEAIKKADRSIISIVMDMRASMLKEDITKTAVEHLFTSIKKISY